MLLVAVALHQLWLVERFDLSAWCGGGFGMFSTTDGWGARHLHAVASSPSFRTSLEIPDELDDDKRRALALPTQKRLRALARALAHRAPHDLEAPHTIRIDVFARRFDAETLAPEGVLLESVEVPLTAGDPAPR
ncbi:MAG: hypothetical protein ACREI8_00015 [Myxococcota bacterium]